jgi:hypothetical protein
VMLKFDYSAHPNLTSTPPSKLLFLFSQLSLSSTKILRIKGMHADKVSSPSHRSTFSMRHKRSLGWEVGNAEQGSHHWPARICSSQGLEIPEPGCSPKRCRALFRGNNLTGRIQPLVLHSGPGHHSLRGLCTAVSSAQSKSI